MTDLNPQPNWSAVRQLEVSEFASGGANGNMNEQAKALAARTELLKQQNMNSKYQFNTYAEFDAVKSNLPVSCTVVIGEENKTGTGSWGIGNNKWNGTTLTKSASDPLTQAKAYADESVNKNLFSGFGYLALTASTIPTGTIYQTPTDLTITNSFSYSANIPIKGLLTKKANIWINVSSVTVGSGNPRVLVQLYKTDKTTIQSVWVSVPAGTTGWFKLSEANLNISPALLDFARLTFDLSNSASLTISDIYVGEATPNTNYVRTKPRYIEDARLVKSLNILSDELLTNKIEANYQRPNILATQAKTLTIPMTPIKETSSLFLSAMFSQVNAGQMIFKLTAKPSDGSANIVLQRASAAVGEIEFQNEYEFGKQVNQVQIEITNTGTSDVLVKNPILTYQLAAQPLYKYVASDYISEDLVVKATATNLALNPLLEGGISGYSSTLGFTESGFELTNGQYVLVGEPKDSRYINGETVYVSLPDADFKLNTGTISVLVYQVNSAGTSLGGITYTIQNDQKVFSAPVVISPNAVSILIRITANGTAVAKVKKLYVGRQELTYNRRYIDVNAIDNTGVVNSLFPYPKLTGYKNVGLQDVVYAKTIDANGDYVLEIPKTTSATQGVYWNFNIPQLLIEKDSYITLNFKCASLTATRFSLIFFGDTGNLGSTAGGLVGKLDNSWTLARIKIPATYNGKAVKAVRLDLTVASTSPTNLSIKRIILDENHNPYVSHINTIGLEQSSSVPNFKRLTDALVTQPQGIFSVGKQIFRPLKTTQVATSDYDLTSSVKNLPTALRNKMYVDGGLYRIATVDSNDDIILHKNGTGNLYRLTPVDFFSRFIKSSVVSGEQFATFDDTNLTPFTTTFSNTFLRIAEDGTLVGASQTSAKYSTDGGVTWSDAVGYADVSGNFFNAWGFNTADNVVLTSGYKVAPERQTGKVNYSSDYGKTYKTIFDVTTATVLSAEARLKTHIHSVAYDKYVKRVWMVLGDYTVPTDNMVGKILYCDNPEDATPIWNVMTSGSDYYAEQHVAIYPMEDCVLFGSDAVATGIYRMSRQEGDLRTDQALFLDSRLTHYGCGGWQQSRDLPMAIYMGKGEDYADPIEDKVFLTFDGVNYSQILSDNDTYAGAGGKVDSFAFAFRNHFILDKRGDARFASANTWVVGNY